MSQTPGRIPQNQTIEYTKLPFNHVLFGNPSGIATPVIIGGDGTFAYPGIFLLKTVNANPGTFNYASIDVDAQGRVTRASTGSGFIVSLNGLTAATQLFSNGFSGTTPAFVSATATHTLNIPMAHTAAVTAGLISKAEFDAFSGGASITVGVTTIGSGTSGRVLYDNAGILGEMTTTGSGTVLVLATSPTLITPVLGVATAISINGLTITSSTGILTLPSGKSFIHSGAHNLTLTTTADTNVTLPTTGTLATLAGAEALSNKTGLISQWTNDVGYITSLAGLVAGGELSGFYPNPTLVNSAVINKILSGYTPFAGVVANGDSLLTAIEKLDGNIGALTTGVSSVSGTANRIVVSPTTGNVIVDIGTSVVTLTGSQALSNKTGLISQWTNDSAYLTGNQTITLSGEASGSGATAITVTLANAAVIAKVLTGLSITGSTIVATDTILQAFGKTQNQINGLLGGAIYQGVWNANTNSPTLVSSSGTKGYYYVVSVAGNTNLDGTTDWKVGDWAIFNGTIWEKVDNTDAVSSVFGRIGAVTAASGDYDTSLVTEDSGFLYFTNARGIAATLTGYTSGAGTISASDSILSAIQKLNGNIAALVTGVASVAGTANRITVTGTVHAVVDISSSYTGQASITTVGTLTGGATGAGFTVALATSTITGVLTGTNGGTGVNNSTRTITIAGNFTTAGANALTLTTTGATNVTLPTTGTLATLAGVENLSNKGLVSSTIGNSNSVTLLDTLFVLQSNADTTKQAKFLLAGISASNTRILSVQDSDGTIAYLSDLTGYVTAISVTTNQGVSGSSSGGTTPALTISLGALTGVTSFNGLVVTANTGVVTTGTWSATTIAINKGGTGNTSYTDGQLLIGNTTGNTLTKAVLTPGTGVSITNGAGTITIALDSAAAVTSVSGTANRITASPITGDVIIDISSSYTGQGSITTVGTINTGVWNGTAIANANLAHSTISGIALGNNLATLTIGTGLSGTSYNGSAAVTITIDSTVATLTGAQSLTNKKLGSLTSNGFVKTSGSDGTLSVDTNTYLQVAITTLNTLTAATQLFSNGFSGTTPAFVSATATHTLNIPMAHTAAVTAGLISKAEFDAFSAASSQWITDTFGITYGLNVGIGTASTEFMRLEVADGTGGTPFTSGLGNFTVGDGITYTDAIINVLNAGNNGNVGNADGSSLVKFAFNDNTALEIDKDGNTLINGSGQFRLIATALPTPLSAIYSTSIQTGNLLIAEDASDVLAMLFHNYYYDGSTTNYIADGFAVGISLNNGDGSILFNAFSSGLSGANVTGSGTILSLLNSGTVRLNKYTSNGFVKTSSTNGTLIIDTNTYITGNQTITLSGDATGSGTTAITVTLATVNANVNTFGSSTSIPTFTVDAKGRLTAASGNAVIAPAGTLTGTVLNATVVTSSLTSVGTLTAGATGAGFTVALSTSTITGTLADARLSANVPLKNAANIFTAFQSVTLATGNVSTILALRNEDATNGYGLQIQSEGTAATRYALILSNLNESVIYGGVSTITGQVGYWGIGATPTGTLGSRLTVNGGISVGASYTGTAAPTNGMLIQGDVRMFSNVLLETIGSKITIKQDTPSYSVGYGITDNDVTCNSSTGVITAPSSGLTATQNISVTCSAASVGSNVLYAFKGPIGNACYLTTVNQSAGYFEIHQEGAANWDGGDITYLVIGTI